VKAFSASELRDLRFPIAIRGFVSLNDGGIGAVIIRLAIIVAACLISAAPTLASRSCLDKNEAGRTWPARQLVKDEDGCWTYRRDP